MGNVTSRFADYRNFCLCLCDFGDKSHDHRSTGWAHSISASRGKKQPLLVVKLASDPLVGTGHGILELQ
jgi:hypothetical protein